ncbi:sulfatase family protein [Algoriphagus formosus]|uniref:N-acetylgalactosamine-6-sulfatase n=1 Tax=Algoriphagus formosus TaxID=2007308 RepID=A0A4R5V7H4_9BACT|nr:sulfatase [Algoriphagus aquimaris]TDK47949.1 N-acetylgalactosamine-6-sulfatase [Algoriphagus aquimaris]
MNNLLKFISIFFLFTLGGSCKTRNKDLPNIIIIYTDDLGYGDVAPFAPKNEITPNLAKLADEGVTLTNFYVASSVCSPSRASLLTGSYPVRVGIPRVLAPHGIPWAEDIWRNGLNPKEETLAELLKEVGYKTTLIGKWHLGHAKEQLPTKHGFDNFFGIPYSNDMIPSKNQVYPPLPLIENEEIIEENPDQRFFTNRFTKKAIEFISNNTNSPFFILLTHPLPHVPLSTSPEFENKTLEGIYNDVIHEIDWSVGQIRKKLQEFELEKNTILIFTSDNGPWLAYQTHAGSAGILREGKNTAFDGGHKVPFLISWPNQLPKGKKLDGLVTNMDLLPTLVAWAGGNKPRFEIDGLSLRDYLEGTSDHSLRKEFLYFHNENLRGIRDERYKLLLPHRYQKPAGNSIDPGQQDRFVIDSIPLSLFDLWEDPGERNDIAEDLPEKVKELQQRMEKEYQKIISGKRPSGIYEGPEPPTGKLWIENY